MKKNCGIIFDCDGTLVNSLGQALESFNFALDQLGEPPRTPESIKQYFGAGADRIFMSILKDEKKALDAFEIYVDHQSELAKQTKLHTGVRELLETLANKNIPLAVVTGRHARDLEVVLKPHKIADYFITLITDNYLPKSKPAPDGILMAAQKLGLAPNQTFYVGDSRVDIQAARAAGSVPVAALWDELVVPEEMKQEGARYMAQRPQDVWDFFKSHFPEFNAG